MLLGRYTVQRVLGQGAFGEVVEVQDAKSGVAYALKRIPQDLAREPRVMESIRANFRLVSRLTHPHIATTRFLETDPATREVYLILDLVRGTTLAQWLADWRAKQADPDAGVPMPTVLGIAEQLAEALDYAHGAQVLHQDLKPDNVMVVEGKEHRPGIPLLKLVDFGIASEIQASITSQSTVMGRDTALGTPPYMAPEQWEGRTLTAAVDQWALAVMMYEMGEGAKPFFGPSPAIIREAVCAAKPAAPRQIPERAWGAMRVALSKERAKRYRSCGAMVRAVRGEAPARSSKAPIAAAALLAFTLVAWRASKPAPRPAPTISVAPRPIESVIPSPAAPAPVVAHEDGFTGEWAVSPSGGSVKDPVAFVSVFADGSCLTLKIGLNPMMPQLGATVTEERGLIEAKDGKVVITATGRLEGTYTILDRDTIRVASNAGLNIWKRQRAADRMDPRLPGVWLPKQFVADFQGEYDDRPGFDQGPVTEGKLQIYAPGVFTVSFMLGTQPVNGAGLMEARDGHILSPQWNADGFAYYVDQARAMGRCRIDPTYKLAAEHVLDITTDQELGVAKSDGTIGTQKKKFTVRYVRADEHGNPLANAAPLLPLFDRAFVGFWKRHGNTKGRATGNFRIDNAMLPRYEGGYPIEISAEGKCRQFFPPGRNWGEWKYFLRTRGDRWIMFQGPGQVWERGGFKLLNDGTISVTNESRNEDERWQRLR